jgi:hypothetical protein
MDRRKSMKKIMVPLILIGILAGISPLCGQGFVLKKDIFVDTEDVQGSVVSFGGNIHIKGRVKQNAIAFGGTITIEGEVGELVLGVGTDIKILSTAVIAGDVVALGGNLERETGSEISGDTIFFETSDDVWGFIKNSFASLGGLPTIPLLLIIKLVSLLVWFIFAITLASLFPRQIAFASQELKRSFWPTVGTGFLSIILFVFMVIFAAFLSLILIGIPILIALVMVGFVIKIFGRIVLFHFFGQIMSKAFSKKKPSVLTAVLAGFVFLSLIDLIPVLSALVSLVLSILGWGIVLRTKFGTTANWFSKKISPSPEQT